MHVKHLVVPWILAALLHPQVAWAVKAGFDCDKASTPVEKKICSSAHTADLDAELNAFFTARLRNSDPASKAQMKQGQREWVKKRDTLCAGDETNRCLDEAYKSRIRELSEPSPAADGTVFQHLDDYADGLHGRSPTGIFGDPSISAAMKQLFGSHFERFKACMPAIEIGERDVDGLGAWVFKGGVSGLFTIMEGIVVIEPHGRLWGAVIEEDGSISYFTSDPKYTDHLPKTIEAWMQTADGAPRLDKSKVVNMNKH